VGDPKPNWGGYVKRELSNTKGHRDSTGQKSGETEGASNQKHQEKGTKRSLNGRKTGQKGGSKEDRKRSLRKGNNSLKGAKKKRLKT